MGWGNNIAKAIGGSLGLASKVATFPIGYAAKNEAQRLTRGALTAGKFSVNNMLGRMVTSTLAGGAYAFATSPHDSLNRTFERTAEGMLWGAAAGVAINAGKTAAVINGKRVWNKYLKHGADPGRLAERFGESGARLTSLASFSGKAALLGGAFGLQAGKTSLNLLSRHPGKILPLVAAGAAVYPGFKFFEGQEWNYGSSVLEGGGGNLGQGGMMLAAGQEQQALNNLMMGSVMPTGNVSSSRAQFMGSTSGLVQGLHRGRHR